MCQVRADRTHRFAAPAWVVYEALAEDLDRWLVLNPGEVRPSTLSATTNQAVVSPGSRYVDERVRYEPSTGC